MRLVAQDLSVERGGRRLIEGLSFALAPGEALVLLGANGSGKTSLLRALCGLLPLAGGQIVLEEAPGEPTPGESSHYIGHDNALKARLTVGENLAFWADVLGGERGERELRAALGKVGLGHVYEVFVGALSAGQKRRVALCRALLAPRPLWLLDEPTTALDAASIGALAALMAAHRGGGGMVIAATHAEIALPGAQTLTLRAPPQAAA
jgi:heme exporter protein A